TRGVAWQNFVVLSGSCGPIDLSEENWHARRKDLRASAATCTYTFATTGSMSVIGRLTPEGRLVYRHTIDATSYVFADLRELLAKAPPPRAGDGLAGIAAGSAEEMIAARMALADVPLSQFLQEAVIPYEADEVTRLVIDTHDAKAFAPVATLTVGGFR